MAIGSDNVFPKLIFSSGTAPATPSAGQGKVYEKSSDKKLYFKNEDGTEYDLTASGGGSLDGAWTTYTPTLTNGTVGNGTVTGRYKQLGDKTFLVNVKFVLGSTSSISGILFFSLPSGHTAVTESQGSWWATNNSGDAAGASITDSTLTKVLGVRWSAGAYVDGNNPYVFASGHKIAMSMTYEIV